MSDSLNVVGGSIASLAVSLLAAKSGRRVDLYVDSSKIGGSFAGVTVGERRFDLGSRLFELDYEDSNSVPISEYDPQHDSHRPYIRKVADFIQDILQEDLRPATTPEMWIAERRTRCVSMTVDLSDLPAALHPADRSLVLEQSRRILEAPSQPETADRTFCEASLAQHGHRLHALLTEVICDKQYPGWNDVLVSERRKLWAALFHTRTVFEAFAGLPITFQPYRLFCTTSANAAYPFVRRLYQAVQASPHITVIPAGPLVGLTFEHTGRAHLRFASGVDAQVQEEKCFIGVPPESLFTGCGIEYSPEKIPSSILWVDVEEHHIKCVPSTLMVCDPALQVLRISNAGGSPGWQSFAVEFGCSPSDATVAAAALQRMGLVAEGAEVLMAHRVAGSFQVAATPSNRRRFEAAKDSLASFRGVLLGGARRFGFDGLNDQIADALYYQSLVEAL